MGTVALVAAARELVPIYQELDQLKYLVKGAVVIELTVLRVARTKV